MKVGTPIPIVALDYPTSAEALSLVRHLGDSCRFYKVGSELFTAAGPSVVEAVRDLGSEVFLDLKFHDIPNTVAGGVRQAAQLGARLVTVHASGGAAMLRAAAGAARESGGCEIMAVTVLTSLSGAELSLAWGRDVTDMEGEVVRLAGMALDCGVHGIVCSGREAGTIRDRFGDRLARLVPGVRLLGDGSQDQTRVVTPGEAARRGATYVVLGRTVTGARDPLVAMNLVLADLAGGNG